MVNVVTSPQSLQKTLEYNFRKVEAGKASILFSQNVSVDDRGLPSFLNTYKDMLALIPKCRTKKITFSCSLNPNPNEKVSDETLTLLAREYMQDLGYGNQPFVVFKHFDIEREHIHIVTTRVDRTGKKINDAFEQERARRIVDKLEIKYGLMPSKNNKYAKQEAKPISLEPLAPSPSPASRITEKVVTASFKAQPISSEKELTRQVRAILGDVLGKWQFSSIGEMNAILARYNLTAEFTQNEHKRKFYNGIVYIPLDAKGNKMGTPITGTEAGRGFGHSAVLHHFKTSKKTILSHLPDMPIAIADVMKQKPKTPEDFRQKLSVRGYEVLFRTNDKGRIYGVTFIDDRNKIVVNGSKLGKAFSANAFNAYFNEGGMWSIDFNFSKAKEKSHGDFISTETPSKNQSNKHNHNRIKDDDTSIADLTDLIGLNTPEPDDSEYQEQKFQRRLRRQAQKAMGVKRRRH